MIPLPPRSTLFPHATHNRSMADMRSIGTACEEYQVDNNFYPVQTTQGDVSAISGFMTPAYIKVVPDTDGWNWNIQYGTTSDGSGYTVRSLGKDGTKNGTGGLTSYFDC